MLNLATVQPSVYLFLISVKVLFWNNTKWRFIVNDQTPFQSVWHFTRFSFHVWKNYFMSLLVQFSLNHFRRCSQVNKKTENILGHLTFIALIHHKLLISTNWFSKSDSRKGLNFSSVQQTQLHEWRHSLHFAFLKEVINLQILNLFITKSQTSLI